MIKKRSRRGSDDDRERKLPLPAGHLSPARSSRLQLYESLRYVMEDAPSVRRAVWMFASCDEMMARQQTRIPLHFAFPGSATMKCSFSFCSSRLAVIPSIPFPSHRIPSRLASRFVRSRPFPFIAFPCTCEIRAAVSTFLPKLSSYGYYTIFVMQSKQEIALAARAQLVGRTLLSHKAYLIKRVIVGANV